MALGHINTLIYFHQESTLCLKILFTFRLSEIAPNCCARVKRPGFTEFKKDPLWTDTQQSPILSRFYNTSKKLQLSTLLIYSLSNFRNTRSYPLQRNHFISMTNWEFNFIDFYIIHNPCGQFLDQIFDPLPPLQTILQNEHYQVTWTLANSPFPCHVHMVYE